MGTLVTFIDFSKVQKLRPKRLLRVVKWVGDNENAIKEAVGGCKIKVDANKRIELIDSYGETYCFVNLGQYIAHGDGYIAQVFNKDELSEIFEKYDVV